MASTPSKSTNNPYKIVIVDDHQMFIDGITSLLSDEPEFNVLSNASGAEELMDILRKSECDILLLDLNLGSENGMDIIPVIKKYYSSVKILIITMYNEPGLIQNAFDHGADGYLLKSAGKDEVLNAMRKVREGISYKMPDLNMGSHVIQSESSRIYSDDFLKRNNLTSRETDIIVLMARSYSTREIADQLCISEMTVSTHRKNIKAKLGLKNLASIVKFAFDNQLI